MSGYDEYSHGSMDMACDLLHEECEVHQDYFNACQLADIYLRKLCTHNHANNVWKAAYWYVVAAESGDPDATAMCNANDPTILKQRSTKEMADKLKEYWDKIKRNSI